MPNVVFDETLGSDIPLERGLQARKHFIKHNSEAGHESLKNPLLYINCVIVMTSTVAATVIYVACVLSGRVANR